MHPMLLDRFASPLLIELPVNGTSFDASFRDFSSVFTATDLLVSSAPIRVHAGDDWVISELA
jgi:hypothetical protein